MFEIVNYKKRKEGSTVAGSKKVVNEMSVDQLKLLYKTHLKTAKGSEEAIHF